MKRVWVGCALVCLGLLIVMQQPARAENPDHVKQLRETGNCPGCDLADASLVGVNAELGDLRGADLTRAYFYKGFLRGANLAGAILNNTDFSGADLRDVRGADLSVAKTNERTTCPNGSGGPCR